MESAAPDAPLAPPVVAVVVVHDPGPWFDEALAALAAQDYPNLNTLFLLTTGVNAASDAEVRRRILARLPDAFVRELGANPGFGAAANEVLRLVEGDSGFFCFCHDDLALDPDAIRMLVEELYRSNAGVVGPKLVSWDDPGLLAHVGLGLDRFGEIDSIIEPGEYDQEQHDRVRDVFVLPSACLLVRADLFRSLGGFDPAISFHGDDIDLCWRVHLSGARVVVAPQARARHREELEVRRPELHHDLLRSRHRVRSVMTLTSGGRLPLRSLEMILLTAAELVVGAFTGRLGEAWSSVRAMLGLVPRLPAILSRRGAVAKIRQVGDAEILPLQERGSARLTSFRRSRDTATYIGAETNVRRWRESTLAVTATWLLLLGAIVVASRTLIDTRVPALGELLPMPASARDLAGDYASAWNPGGLGGTVANPTGWAVLSVASVFWLFKMGVGLTFLLIGLVVLGVWGMWRLATVFPTNRARITALLVYAAVPLLPGIISTGRLSALVAYAAVPWFV
ncbi:MAG: glycosyltransferase, partial [Ilumatobacteraceae bacterium]